MLRLTLCADSTDGIQYWIEVDPKINPHTGKIFDLGPAELYNSNGWIMTHRSMENLVRVAYARMIEDRHQPQHKEEYAKENVPRLQEKPDAPEVPKKVEWGLRGRRHNPVKQKLRLGKLLPAEVAAERNEGRSRSPEVDGGGGGNWHTDSLLD